MSPPDDDALAERLADAVRAHPGLTLYRLAILLNVDERQLDRVMTKLARERRLSCRTLRASVRWYGPDGPTDREPSITGIRPGMRAWEALVLAGRHPRGVTPETVALCTPLSAAYAYTMIRRLEANQLVTRCGEERRWVISQKGRDLLAREQGDTGFSSKQASARSDKNTRNPQG